MLPSIVLACSLCLGLGLLASRFLSPDPAPPPVGPEPDLSPEAAAHKARALALHAKASEVIDAFLDRQSPVDRSILLRPTPGLRDHLSRYDAELDRLSALRHKTSTSIIVKGSFVAVPVTFANSETRTAWLESVDDETLLLDHDSFLACSDSSFAEAKLRPPASPVRLRGYGRIIPPSADAEEGAPELLALRDPGRSTLLLLQIDAHSGLPRPVLDRLRETTKQVPILLEAAASPSPTTRSKLRVVKIHSLHWLYAPDLDLIPDPDELPGEP